MAKVQGGVRLGHRAASGQIIQEMGLGFTWPERDCLSIIDLFAGFPGKQAKQKGSGHAYQRLNSNRNNRNSSNNGNNGNNGNNKKPGRENKHRLLLVGKVAAKPVGKMVERAARQVVEKEWLKNRVAEKGKKGGCGLDSGRPRGRHC